MSKFIEKLEYRNLKFKKNMKYFYFEEIYFNGKG